MDEERGCQLRVKVCIPHFGIRSTTKDVSGSACNGANRLMGGG